MAWESSVWRPQAAFSHTLTTSNQIEKLNADGGIALSFAPLRRTSVYLAFDGSQSKSLSIWKTRSRSGFISTPKFEAELFTIRFVTNGTILRKNRQGTPIIASRDDATFQAFEGMQIDQVSANFEALTATITQSALLIACEALEGTDLKALPTFSPVVDANARGMIALRQVLKSLHRRLGEGVRDADFFFPLMEEIVVYHFLSTWQRIGSSVSPSESTSAKSIARAVEYIEASLVRKMTIAEIAAAAGISVRMLQFSFRRHFGCSPIEYLINRRLDQVHKALSMSGGEQTVRHIAGQWGFVHMSDFNRRYRLRFGETPATSLESFSRF